MPSFTGSARGSDPTLCYAVYHLLSCGGIAAPYSKQIGNPPRPWWWPSHSSPNWNLVEPSMFECFIPLFYFFGASETQLRRQIYFINELRLQRIGHHRGGFFGHWFAWLCLLLTFCGRGSNHVNFDREEWIRNRSPWFLYLSPETGASPSKYFLVTDCEKWNSY